MTLSEIVQTAIVKAISEIPNSTGDGDTAIEDFTAAMINMDTRLAETNENLRELSYQLKQLGSQLK